MFLKLIFIATGGALGTLARYGTGTLLARATERTGFPWGTLAVNLLGCFLIGLLQGIFSRRLTSDEYRLGLIVGFLGGYTTFSAYGWETATQMRDGQYGYAGLNFLGNNVLGLVLVMAGYALGRGRA